MNKSILKILLTVFAVIFFNNCSIGDYTDLWPTESDENSEVVIREIPGDSFDPEDTEEVDVVISNEDDSEITIIDEITENEDASLSSVPENDDKNKDTVLEDWYSEHAEESNNNFMEETDTLADSSATRSSDQNSISIEKNDLEMANESNKN